MSEKTEQPTSKRLRDSRQKGDVAYSKDFTQTFLILAIFGYLLVSAGHIVETLGQMILLPGTLLRLGFNEAANTLIQELLKQAAWIVLPFIGIGLIQVTVILVVGHWLFGVPVRGAILDLYGASLLFIVASLALGVWLSTLASTQFQAMQMSFFAFLPSILLSGFMFPFSGMPTWAQWIGEVLPLTHFLRIVRGIMLKGSTLAELLPELWALLAFTVVVSAVALLRYRQTLD